ncbi:hypothetical protein BT96DRAFT_1012287 [Gymnopus androsaceus JB14]|uniref:F-box domain-containing protein n=1 Tax=Gymnopus androsaceus JB14 TaxID=1447944 RepID=A0A6A4IJ85_9AGAR|nr:hypothetical protein BT96DRAFT_1012287 [Gymnopus androsaceus JB14]
MLGAYIACVRSTMSPIRILPVELLGEIFKYVCCGDIGTNQISEAEKRLPTLTLSRASAVNDPNPFTPLFDMFLECSHSLPIDFEIQCLYSQLSNSCLSSLTARKNRWRHVKIAIDEGILRSFIDGRQSLPGLVSLSLRSGFGDGTEISFPANCPTLQSLTLHWVPLNLEYHRPLITHLKLVSLNPTEAAQVILHCPGLEVKELIDQNSPLPNVSCNIKSSLWTLRIPSQILNSLTFPELTTLKLSEPRRHSQTDLYVTPLCSMLERSQHRVTHLILHFIPFTSDKLLRLFLYLPLVSTLEVEELKELHGRAGIFTADSQQI